MIFNITKLSKIRYINKDNVVLGKRITILVIFSLQCPMIGTSISMIYSYLTQQKA